MPRRANSALIEQGRAEAAWKKGKMNRAFSLVELMIVVAVLGILAAIVVPQFQSHTSEARASTSKNNLRIVRGAIELYSAQHGGVPPGYPGDDIEAAPQDAAFYASLTGGNYLSKKPANPFNKLTTIRMISNDGTFPAAATGQFGWIYQPATKEFRMDRPGADSTGTSFYSY